MSLRESENQEANRLEREVAAWRALLTADGEVTKELIKTATYFGRASDAWEHIGAHDQAVRDEDEKIAIVQEAGVVTHDQARILAYIQHLEERITQLLQQRTTRLRQYLEENLPAIRQACKDLRDIVQSGRGVSADEKLHITVQLYPDLERQFEAFRTKQPGAEPLKILENFLQQVQEVRASDVRSAWNTHQELLQEFLPGDALDGAGGGR